MWTSAVDVPGPHVDALAAACAAHGIHCVIGVNERESARPGHALQHDARDRPGRAAAPAPQADADDAGAGVPRPRRRRRPRRDRDAGRPDRRADLLGEPDAARPLAGLRGRPADLGRADRRRLRRLAGVDAAHRDRVGRLRRLRPAVHPGQRVPRGLPGRGGPREGLRPRRRGDRRAHVGRGDRRPAYDREGIVVADCDLRAGLHAKRWFDAVGHYARRRGARASD